MVLSIPDSGRGVGEERVFRIESASRPGLFHYVDLENNHCSCEARVPICRHIRIARIRAKLEQPIACMGCGKRYARRDLIELQEGEHDNLTFFDGDIVCKRCAAEVGGA